MFELENILRANVIGLESYSCARDEYSGEDAVLLDANENPYENGCNRYPDPYQRKLKGVLAGIKRVDADRIVLGNGSDELIDLLLRCICEPKRDNIIVFSPGYSMYEVSAAINEAEVRRIDLSPDFQPDWKEAARRTDANTKAIFLCTPNNPTGTVIPLEDITALCDWFGGLVVVDEAYIDFTEKPSALTLSGRFENLVVLQTLSKSWGMAGLRIGMCFASPALVRVLNRVKPPYNISSIAQEAAMRLLEKGGEFVVRLENIKIERERLLAFFKTLSYLECVYSSEANFILVTCRRFRELYKYLTENKVVVRQRNIPPLIPGGIRVSVGTPEENERLIRLLGEWGR